MALYIRFYTVFCVVLLSINAEVIKRPQLYVTDNNLYFQIPAGKFIRFDAQQVIVNNVDLMPTLEKAQNATKLLRKYETFIFQFYSKMDDMDDKIRNLDFGGSNSTTNNTAGIINLRVIVRRLSNRVLELRGAVQQLQNMLLKDECKKNPCQNGGTCIDIFNGFLCQCPNGWEGLTCQTDINECARFVGTDLGCQNGGTCLNLPGTYQCQCPRAWVGIHCNRKPSDCNSGGFEICGHGTCVPQNNEVGYKCLCDSGWTTDGTRMACSVDVDECKQNHPPCSTNPLVQCINLPGSFMCQHCPPGYTGNGYYCADVNECELFNGGCSVSPYVQCINTPGSSNCGPCPAGYEGDGKKCTYKGVCNINNGGCSILARCVDNPAISATFVQCICPAGYTGPGLGPTGCMKASSGEITSCSPNPCVHGVCSASGQGFRCVCDRQYTGTYCDQQMNQCASNPCLNGGTCMVRRFRFTYTCTCLPGFMGRQCQKERQACGDSFTSSNGTITYPSSEFNSSRETARLSCAWTIRTEQNKVLEISFSKFNLADSPCNSQWFQVHDGRNSLATALGRFCGKTLPFNGSLTTTRNVIYFWLRSNGQTNTQPEFELSWITKDPACGGTLSQEGIGMITSPGWPNNYPNNRECYWRFSVPVNKRLLFHVYSLNIGQDSNCTGDYLEFYVEKRVKLFVNEAATPQLFAKLCNSTIPDPFYSIFPSGYVYFKSNERDTYPGFQIGYSVVDGIPGCGGTYTNKDGYIQSIEVTSSMPTPLLCAFEIRLPANSTIKIEIVEMDLEDSCDETNVAIYKMLQSDTNLIGRYCGSQLPGPIRTYGNHILIKSQSRYGSKNSWKIRYESICLKTYTEPEGTINAAVGWKECSYLIEQPPGRIIFLELDVLGPRNWHSDLRLFFIEVRDGDNENATLIDGYSQPGIKVKLQSSTNYLLIKARFNEIIITRFEARYSTQNLGCGELLKNDQGSIAYPPQNVEKYSADKKCRWVIMAPPGKVIQLTWMILNLEQSIDCTYDNVKIYDNNADTGMGGLLGKFCGYTVPPIMISSSNMMTIDFTSDSSIHGEGFMVSYIFIKENNICGGNYFTTAGIIKSPGYPQNYPINRECVWTIKVQPGSQIMLKFESFNLESYSSCRYDSLEIRNGATSTSPLIGKYCGTTYPKTIPSHANSLYIKFISDMSRTAPGFKISWSSAATGCGGILSSPSGSIMSPHYPEPYAANTDCLWKITVSAGSKIQLIFADIDLEKNRQCGLLDYVQLFDGPTINSLSLGKFCSQPINPVLSSQNNMLVRFRSDISFEGHGFNIQYSTICTNTLKGFRGIIESPNFPNDYPQDQSCLWDIIVDEGNKINISFSHFALERSSTVKNKSCTFDYVEIEYASQIPDHNDDPTWLIYDRYCGDNNPGSITINSNMAKVHFVSDSLLLGSGFRLEWQLFGCGGVLTGNKGIIESPNYPQPYPGNTECNWVITVPLGKSINITFEKIDIEKDSLCAYDYIKIFNGKDDTYQEITTLCHHLKPITITSSGNNMLVKFKADYSYEGRGFRATYETTSTTCGGLLTAPSGNIFSPNYPNNFNKNETCEWLIDIDQNHVIELTFEDVDLSKRADCRTNYIKIYDGPTQAYPVLDTICGNTTNVTSKIVRSTFEHMFIEFRNNYYLTSKGFKASYKKGCGAKIKTSGSGQIQFSKSYNFIYDYNEGVNCSYTIEAEDRSKHVTLTITQLYTGTTWCDQESPVLKIYNGQFNDSPLIGNYCMSKVPPPITSDGSALHIEIYNEIDFFATYSVLDDQCGGTLNSDQGLLATPGWPKSYPNDVQCSWTILMGPGNTIHLSFIEFDIPESENCNSDFVEIRETSATGKLLGVFCGTNSAANITAIGTLYIIFKSSRLDEGIIATKKGFYIEYAAGMENVLSGPEGEIGNLHYPKPIPYGSYNPYTWLITTNVSTIIELTLVEVLIGSNSPDCSGNVIKVYDGMDADAPLLKEICRSDSPESILSTSNMMYITADYYTYSTRTNAKFLLKWKELAVRNAKTATSNTTKSACQYAYKLEPISNVVLTSPGYPHGYGPGLHCEWIYEIQPQYHLWVALTDVDFGVWNNYRICTYTDNLKIYTKRVESINWELLQEFCNSSKSRQEIEGSNLMKVEFNTNKYQNGSGFRAEVFTACGGTLTEPSGVIELDKAHTYYSDCQWNITVRPGRTINLTFDQFELGPTDPNCKRYLIIRNGKFPDSPFLGDGKFCGPEVPPDLESISNHLYLKYSGLPPTKGIKIKYREVSIDCGQSLRLSIDQTSVEIASPNYPNIPQAHSECIWIISAPPGQALRVDFEERFDISQYNDCTTDYVELRDGGTELSPLIGRYCYEAPGTTFTTDNMFRLKYFTDSNEPRNGFKAKVSISYCGGTLRGGGIISTTEPHVIGAGKNCTWYIKAPQDSYILMDFLVFRVGQHSINCNGEDVGKVIVYEVNSVDTNSKVICGRANLTTMRFSSNEVILNYLAKSDQDEFRVNVTMVKEACGDTLTQETGIITSPGYPTARYKKRHCFWKIRVPKGRRISIFVQDVDFDQTTSFLIIFQGFNTGPILAEVKETHKTYETSDNTAHILFYHRQQTNTRGFKLKFTSNKQTVCAGDFNATSGYFSAPETVDPYVCEYVHIKQAGTEQTLAIKITMETNITKAGLNRLCSTSTTGIRIFSSPKEALGYVCQDTNNRPIIFRSSYPMTTLSVLRHDSKTLNFTINYNTYRCGGLLENNRGIISSPNFPNTPSLSYECSWLIKSSSRIKINFTSFDLGNDCDKSYLVIYNGRTALSPKLGVFCRNRKPETIISQKSELLIEYGYDRDGNTTSSGFRLQYEPEIHGCGGVYQTKNTNIQTPNYETGYGNNEECIWDIKAEEGNMIKLYFFDRFYIEDSVNCTKDYVEIFDWRDDTWVSLAKKCGRIIPGNITSSSSQLRIIFRSNEKITGTGFRASWEWQCGGILEAVEKERYLVSPGYTSTNFRYKPTHCTYKIVAKRDQGIVKVKFLDMNLGTGAFLNCDYANLTITGIMSSGRLLHSTKQVFCGSDIPPIQRYRKGIIINYSNVPQYYSWTSGFKLVYKDESCGGNISTPTALEVSGNDRVLGFMRYYQAKISCTWYITAPPNQVPVLSIHNLSMSLGIHCIAQYLDVYSGTESKQENRLIQLCAKVTESTPIPSKSNTMMIKLNSPAYNFNGFKGEIYFTYGPSAGCGGSINLTETKHITFPNNLPHMDCHWIITAPRDYKVELEFSDISISASCENPVRNHTYYCTCSFVEVRDGGGPFADQMVRLCSSDNNSKRTLTTSWNSAYVRLYSAVPQNDMFKLTLKPVQSICGPSLLTATKQLQTLTSPDYPNSYPDRVKCTWVIKSPGRFMVHFEELDFSDETSSTVCDGDKLEITENPNQHVITEGFGPNAKYQQQNALGMYREALKYSYCDNETKPFDYFTSGKQVTLIFTSIPYNGNKGRGFKLKYGTSGCNRTIHANEGRIQNDMSNNESNCEITIIADPNTTISIYFITFYFVNSDTSCSRFGLEIRENNSTGSLIKRACGFRLPDPIFSNSNQIYIKAYNLEQKPVSYFKYNFLYVSSEKGKGCGGKLFNYMGKFSSPMYPNPYRNDIECTWEVTVPKGYKVALKFSVFNIGGGCSKNNVAVKTFSEGAMSLHTFCLEDTPAVLFSDNNLQVTYHSTVNNGGTGWLAMFQAIHHESDILLWY